MKLLFENWRQYLKEEVETKVAKPENEPETDEYTSPYEYEKTPEKTKETYFGKSPDSLQCIRDLRNPEIDVFPPDFYECMEQEGYTKLGAGSFRAVFNVPENPELVLKIVGPANTRLSDQRRAMKMNKEEAKASFQTSSDLIPKVYDSARDYFWIISEKVATIPTWREMQGFFPVWRSENEDDFSWWFQKLISSRLMEAHAIDMLDRREPPGENSGEKLVNDPLILQIRDLLAQFGLPAWDIRPHNVGSALRSGKREFVILDPGFVLGQEVGTVSGHEASTPLPGISDIFKDDIAQTWQPEDKKAIATTDIMENWRHLIKESRGPKDFHYKITQSSKKIVIEPLNLKTKEFEPGKVKGNAQVILEKRTDIPYWQLAWSNSPQGSEGVGIILYLMALELAGNEGLAPDDYEQTPEALRVWTKFMPEKNRFGVFKEKKEEFAHDNDENPFFFVFYKSKDSILRQYSKNISFEQGQEEEPTIEPEIEPFSAEEDWESLYDDDILQEEAKDVNKFAKVVILNKNNQILLLKRSDKPYNWDLPGGHLKKGEEFASAAKRETKEETNLIISGLKHVKTVENLRFYKTNNYKGQIKLDFDENTDYKWVKTDNLDDFKMKRGFKAEIKDIIGTIKEDFQQKVKKKHRKMKLRLIGMGKNKDKYGKKTSYNRAKSAPPGAGGT